MNATIHLTWQAIKLYLRTRVSLFTMVLMPLGMFFVYMSIFANGHPEQVTAFLGPVLVLMATMNGMYGIGGDILMMREQGILLPYQLTPVTSLQMLGSRLVVDFVLTLAVGSLQIALAVWLYGVHLLAAPWELFVILSLATFALGTMGVVIISVANSFPEANMLGQLIFLVLLIMSGMTVPLSSLPAFIRGFAQFLPTTMLITAFHGILVNGDHLSAHWREIVIIVLFIGASLTVAATLFRWDTEQKATSRDRLKAVFAVAPLVIAGIWFNLR